MLLCLFTFTFSICTCIFQIGVWSWQDIGIPGYGFSKYTNLVTWAQTYVVIYYRYLATPQPNFYHILPGYPGSSLKELGARYPQSCSSSFLLSLSPSLPIPPAGLPGPPRLKTPGFTTCYKRPWWRSHREPKQISITHMSICTKLVIKPCNWLTIGNESTCIKAVLYCKIHAKIQWPIHGHWGLPPLLCLHYWHSQLTRHWKDELDKGMQKPKDHICDWADLWQDIKDYLQNIIRHYLYPTSPSTSSFQTLQNNQFTQGVQVLACDFQIFEKLPIQKHRGSPNAWSWLYDEQVQIQWNVRFPLCRGI